MMMMPVFVLSETKTMSESFDMNGDQPHQWPEDLPPMRATVRDLNSHRAAECLLHAFAEFSDRAAF